MKDLLIAFLICGLIATAFIVGLGIVFILIFIGCSILIISKIVGYFDKLKNKKGRYRRIKKI